jgi:DNA-binding NarL/FixJ family response regulator
MLGEREGLKIVGEAGDGLELLNLLKEVKLAPHLIFLDITMPNLGGIEATLQVKKNYPDIKILILSMHREREYVEQAISVGAEGYLLKDNVTTEVFCAIERVKEGGVYISPFFSQKFPNDPG